MIEKRLPFISALTVAVLVWGLAVPLAPAAEDNPAFLQAQALMAEGKNTEALELLDGIIDASTNDPEQAATVAEAHYLKAKIYFTSRDIEQVDRELTQVYEVCPDFEKAESDIEFRLYMKSAKSRVDSRTGVAHVEKPARGAPPSRFEKKKKLPLLGMVAAAVLAGGVAFLFIRQKGTTPPPVGDALITRLDSVPSGAAVYLDLVRVGTTPLSNLVVKSGSRTITLTDSTYGTAVKSIDIRKDVRYRMKVVISPFGYREYMYWGSRGAGNGQFLSPQGCVVSRDFIYVCDSDPAASRIQKFNLTGHFNAQWKTKNLSPVGIAVDKDENLYVTTAGGVEKYTANGALIGILAGGLHQAHGIAIPQSGEFFFVAEASSIRKYSKNGALLASWSQGYGGSNNPRGLALDSGGNLYASIHPGSAAPVRIHKFNPSGILVSSWEMQGSGSGRRGTPLLFPLIMDRRSNLLFGDTGTNRIVVCRTDGSLQARVTEDFSWSMFLKGMAQDSSGYVYLSCSSPVDAKILKYYPRSDSLDGGQWEILEEGGLSTAKAIGVAQPGRLQVDAAQGDKRHKR